MKTKVLLLLIVFTSPGFADPSPYRQSIEAAKQTFSFLQQQRLTRELTPAEEKEFFAALGELTADDPVWALQRELGADFGVLHSAGSQKPQDLAAMDELKVFMAITVDVEQRATTLAEARAFGQILREFVVRHDVKGATAWAKAQ